MSEELEAFNKLVDEAVGPADGPVRLPPVAKPPAYLEDENGAPAASSVPPLVDWIGDPTKEQKVGELVIDREIFIPEMTTEELEKGTPPTGKLLKRVKIPEGVSPEFFKDSLAGAYMSYLLDGQVTVDGITQRTGRQEHATRKLLAAPEFQEAMKARGIVAAGSSGLTSEQDYALQIILDPYDNLPMRRKLEKAKVSNSKFQAWMKNPLFSAHVDRMAEQITANSSTALIQLANKVGEGDMTAIKYQLELNGRYAPGEQRTIDVMVIMQQMMEVIARNITDQGTLARIAGEMRQIAEGVQNKTQRTPGIIGG